ncbi:MAG: DNA polymerase III subunit alpha [Deltaproteobacteria bacterium]|nr:MAG: DNA polymerase III subunit alpha [Deltaproteobacteria bacterium]
MSFVHLHTHTHFSMLDSTVRINDLVDRAAQDGSGAVAITDHNNLFGAVEFLKAAKKAEVKPIYGAEINLTADDRRNGEIRKTYTLVLLCKDLTGYRNLCYLLSRAYMDAPAKAPGPRIDRALLNERKEGLLALSGGLSGEIPQALLRRSYEEAASLARTYQGMFGADSFYLEIIKSGIREQEEVNEGLVRLSEELEIPLVAGGDVHYASKTDAAAHEILMCVQLGKSVADQSGPARITDDLDLAPAAEMVERFADYPEAVANTLAIAERCNVEIPLGKTFLPTFQVPEGFESESYLAHLANEGLQRRIKTSRGQGLTLDDEEYQRRLDYELGVINQMGFPGYFLIVWDFINYGKSHGVPVGPGRGSGAGSLVAYSLGITDIDPLRYQLLFERFLNPERVSMPDFDIDFCMNKRDRVIQYVTQKYGSNNVGQIITYGTMKAKAVVRDVARVLGLTFAEADRAAKLIPDDLGMTLKKAFEVEPRLKALTEEDERYAKLFEYARTLEGLNRQPGMHAAGVVIGDKPLWDYVPLYAVHTEDESLTLITQFAKNEVEEAGLVKFDFLGLKTLTVVDHAVRLINEKHKREGKEPLDIMLIDLADKAVFDNIMRGDTTGVFQLESSGFKDLLRRLKPDCFEDIIAAVALYRPGPLQSGMVDSFIKRKHGEEAVTYDHPSLSDILEETYGVMVYQEQVMQSASALAGFSLGQADILRRAMGKKKPAEMVKQRKVFNAGCAERGVPDDQATRIFDNIEKFAGYGFNKSHSAAYGLITYQTAWLKTHHPVEFMAALLTSDGDNTDKVVRLIAETRSMGITVLPPSVNHSDNDFTTGANAIRFGLGAVKGVGGGAVEAILQARDEDGTFPDLYDFCERVDLRRVNRRVLEALVKCGAFDEFGDPRMSLWTDLDRAIERGQTVQRDRAAGQFSLFGALEPAAPPPKPARDALVLREEWPDKQRLAYEKECLGFYVSGHPLDRYANDIRRLGATPIARLNEIEDRTEVVVAAVIADLRERMTKTGSGRMAFINLEDLTGRIELLVFTKAYPSFEPYLKADEPLLVTARVTREGEGDARQLKLRADTCTTLREARADRTSRARITLPADVVGEAHLEHLQDILGVTDPTATVPVDVVVDVPAQGKVTLRLDERWRLPVDDEAIDKVERVVGKGNVAFV